MRQMMTAAQWNMRIKNEYNTMCLFPICSLFSWKIAPGQNPPMVRSYLVTYRVKTIVKDGGRLKPQERTVVRISLPDSPGSDPMAQIIEGHVPYHPNWYDNGRLCNGDMWEKDPILWKYVINIGRTLAFDPAVTNPDSPANGEAAANWKVKQKRTRKPYPCGRTDFPHPMGY